MKLYFQNSYGKERVIAKVADEQEAMKEMHKFMDDHNFKSYYTRITYEPDGSKIYDVGSWSEFFILREDYI